MIERTQDKPSHESGALPDAPEELSFRIEIWDETLPAKLERVLARAFSAILAQAIYKAAQAEHPDRRITLSQGDRLIGDSASAPGPG
jgi:hypothetical protein